MSEALTVLTRLLIVSKSEQNLIVMFKVVKEHTLSSSEVTLCNSISLSSSGLNTIFYPEGRNE